MLIWVFSAISMNKILNQVINVRVQSYLEDTVEPCIKYQA